MPKPLESQRQATIETLQDGFAHAQLNEADFEHRLERCIHASSSTELAGLVQDLSPQTPSVSLEPSAFALEPLLDSSSLTVWSKQKHDLCGISLRGQSFVALMGELTLDLRGASLQEDPAKLKLVSMMGKIRIIVPPGLHIETSGSVILGRIKKDLSPLSNPAPTLHLHAKVFSGEVEIIQCRPAESIAQAKRRHAAERRALKGDKPRMLPGGTRN